MDALIIAKELANYVEGLGFFQTFEDNDEETIKGFFGDFKVKSGIIEADSNYVYSYDEPIGELEFDAELEVENSIIYLYKVE